MKTSKNLTFSLDSILLNPIQKKQLEGFLEEIVLCRQSIKTKQHDIKDIIIEAKDNLGIPCKILNGLVNEKMNPGTIDQKQHEIEEMDNFATGLGIKD